MTRVTATHPQKSTIVTLGLCFAFFALPNAQARPEGSQDLGSLQGLDARTQIESPSPILVKLSDFAQAMTESRIPMLARVPSTWHRAKKTLFVPSAPKKKLLSTALRQWNASMTTAAPWVAMLRRPCGTESQRSSRRTTQYKSWSAICCQPNVRYGTWQRVRCARTQATRNISPRARHLSFRFCWRARDLATRQHPLVFSKLTCFPQRLNPPRFWRTGLVGSVASWCL